MWPGDALYSRGGGHFAVMQGDGNFVVYNAYHQALFDTQTWGHWYDVFATLQTDGNFVLYDYYGHALWWSGTWGHYTDRICMGDDGILRILGARGEVWWQS
jgi:hypothetical protein